MGLRIGLRFLVGLIALLSVESGFAKVFVSLDEALKLEFPGAILTPENRFLSPPQRTQAAELSHEEVSSQLVTRFVARLGDRIVGYGYPDTHRVRTHPETVLVIVGPDEAVKKVEVLSFDEPTDYKPRVEWYGKFTGLRFNSELEVKKAIPPMAGATLTVKATAAAVRRVLAIHQILEKHL